MSYQEKNITVALISHILIAGYYVINWLPMFQAGTLAAHRLYSLWLVVILATILVNIIASILTNILLTIVEAIKTKKYEEPRFIADERDQIFELKGTRASYITFSVGVLLSVLAFAFGQPALVMISMIVFFALLAEILGDIFQIFLYRRGF